MDWGYSEVRPKWGILHNAACGIIIELANKGDCTPFYKACSYGCTEIVKFLAGKLSPEQMMIADEDGETPFAAASEWGHNDIVDILKARGITK